MPVIVVRDLVKQYHRSKRITGRWGALRTLFTRQREVVCAVDGIGFDIEPGEMVAYLGPNGAGKSTTVKLLCGILTPTSGTVEVAGVRPWFDRVRNARQIGVVFGQRSQLWWDLPLRDSLDLVGRLYEVRPARYRENLRRFTDLLQMSAFLNTPVRQLSLGQRMRGELAAAMMHEPRILYLDEPTIGLDVLARDRIRTFIHELNRDRGVTVILTTHDLTDVERLCHRLLLIDNGRLLHDGDLASLKATFPTYRQLVVRMPGCTRAPELAGVEVSPRGNGDWVLRFDPAAVNVAELVGTVLGRYPVTDLSILEPSLEDVVHRLYGTAGPPVRPASETQPA
ncbi:ATP-binding cassette domain-containing protein [Micromonospora sp. NPDC048898]|uniref:ABC transporter ATP-binding protein n=1 Tax=Micromonospora sp. NPDC048898 TaxID=3364260 RepID=UPI003718866C